MLLPHPDPGMGADALPALRDSYQAVILQSFGGGRCARRRQRPLARAMEDWLRAGKTIVMMTQVPYGRAVIWRSIR